jgi:uncharacterized protein YegP (UPF0339 family)
MAITASKTVPRLPDASSAVFEVYEDNGSRFHWRLLANDGQWLGDSHHIFPSQRDAQHAAEVVRECMGAATVRRDDDGTGSPRFGGSS